MKKIFLNELINKYEYFLIDQWGVLHNGFKKFNFVDDSRCTVDLVEAQKFLLK